MTDSVRITQGDRFSCPRCRRVREVFTVDGAHPIHCIKCDEGIYIVGVDQATVQPRLVIDHAPA
jgi:hypothetical protein